MMTEKEYRSHPALAWSDLKVFMEEGYTNFWHKKFSNKYVSIPSDSQILGTKVHKFLLENKDFFNDYVLFDGERPTSKNMEEFCLYMSCREPDCIEAYKSCYKTAGMSEKKIESSAEALYSQMKPYIEIVADIEKGKKEVTKKELDLLEELNKVYTSNPIIKSIYQNMKVCVETPLFSNFQEIDIFMESKGKIDLIGISEDEIVIIDLKTTTFAGEESFSKTAKNYKYNYQMAYYYKLVNDTLAISDKPYKIYTYIVALQTKEPYDCKVYEIAKVDIDYVLNFFINPAVQQLDYKLKEYNNKVKENEVYFNSKPEYLYQTKPILLNI